MFFSQGYGIGQMEISRFRSDQASTETRVAAYRLPAPFSTPGNHISTCVMRSYSTDGMPIDAVVVALSNLALASRHVGDHTR